MTTRKFTDYSLALCPALVWLLPLLICEPLSLSLSLLCSVFIHESGHIFAFSLSRAGRVRLFGSAGGLLLTPTHQLSYGRELVVAMFGPLFNLAFAFVLLACTRIWESDALRLLIGVNISCALCNLLPVFELDGGRILFSLCAMIFSLDTAQKVQKGVSLALLSIMLFFSLYLVLMLDAGYRILLWVAVIALASDKNKR